MLKVKLIFFYLSLSGFLKVHVHAWHQVLQTYLLRVGLKSFFPILPNLHPNFKVEMDSQCQQVIAHRQSDGLASPGPIYPDVCTYKPNSVERKAKGVLGGFPCHVQPSVLQCCTCLSHCSFFPPFLQALQVQNHCRAYVVLARCKQKKIIERG